MATQRLITEWQDAAGGFIRCANWATVPGGIAAMMAAAQALSNASINLYTTGITGSPGVPPTQDVTWWLCTDTAVLTLQCADGTNVQFVVPAPKQSIMTPAGLVVDQSNPLVAAFLTAAIGCLGNVASSTVVSWVSGVKSSRRVEQNAPQG